MKLAPILRTYNASQLHFTSILNDFLGTNTAAVQFPWLWLQCKKKKKKNERRTNILINSSFYEPRFGRTMHSCIGIRSTWARHDESIWHAIVQSARRIAAAFLQITWMAREKTKSTFSSGSTLHSLHNIATCSHLTCIIMIILHMIHYTQWSWPWNLYCSNDFDGILSIEPQGMRKNWKHAKWAKRNTDRWFLAENKSIKCCALPFDAKR